MPIRQLPEAVASQIAAGEVIERPASVVKELIENALDAGATAIHVEIAGAGRRLIRVSDDGAGIPADETALAFARHATSKLAVAADLYCVKTLGFRGEALASIASVARVTLLTRSRDEAVGTEMRVEAGDVRRRSAAGTPAGTIVAVEGLFFNVPARLKFLRSDLTEKRQMDALITRYALAYPGVRFQLMHDGRETFRSPGSGDLRQALASVFGLEVARQMIEVGGWTRDEGRRTTDDRRRTTDEGQRSEVGGEKSEVGRQRPEGAASDVRPPTSDLQTRGYVAPPSITRTNRREITLFVNGRWVQDQRLTAAVVQAYHSLLMVGRYPVALILLSLPPEDVDVNVHPAKAEVRFRDADAAFRAVERSVRTALLQHAPVPAATPSPEWSVAGWQARRERLMGPGWRSEAEAGPRPLYPAPEPGPPADSAVSDAPPPSTLENLPLPAADLPLLRAVGQVGAAYLVAEGPDGLYLIDQHAAHERVLYEEWMAGLLSGRLAAQSLLEAETVELPPEAAVILESQLGVLRQLGFEVEAFGRNTYLIRALPAIVATGHAAAALRTVVEDFEEDETPLASQTEARLIARICKRAAVKAGQVLSLVEQQELIRRLERCRAPRTCPHGRPTMIHLSVDTLERQFGRRG